MRIAILFTLFLALAGCNANSLHKGQHSEIATAVNSNTTHNTIILPADIQIFEMGVTGSEEVPGWTQAGKRLIDDEIGRQLAGINPLQITSVPNLTDEEQALLDQYTELYYPVIQSEMMRARQPAWKDHKSVSETTLGPGLRFLKDKYNVDYAVLVSGQDYVSTAGRKATFAIAAAFGVAIPMGFSYMTVGVVDTRTGHVLWNNFIASGDLGFTDLTEANKVVSASLQPLPAALSGSVQVAKSE